MPRKKHGYIKDKIGKKNKMPPKMDKATIAPPKIIQAITDTGGICIYDQDGNMIVPKKTARTQVQSLVNVFLPAGYPYTVSDDYTSYQVYDSLQAFFSTIAGLLSSRAVLQGMGVGDAASSATAAVLLTVFQESTGRLATILFAHRYGRAIEPECKFYRYLADIVNDSAMFLDILSPALPFYPKVLALCAAGILRALCGVSGGAAKAALSAHFARNGNLAELNAKDGSQETVISLVGMLAGSLFVHFVHSREAVMAWMVVLITLHLWTNYQAVSAVQLNTLNAQRLTIILDEFYCGSGAILRPNQVAAKENILNWVGPAIHFADCLPECSEVEGVNLEDFVDVGYVIVDGKKGKKIFLKDRPYHPAFLLLGDPLDPVIAWIEAYAGVRLSEENDMWQRLLDAGWKLHTSSLETGPAIRVIFNDSKNNPV